ncbi:unnamed protein product [Closterium sp. NIES-64]|nr:unnamed protein product [Closterium sp. NIES-64]
MRVHVEAVQVSEPVLVGLGSGGEAGAGRRRIGNGFPVGGSRWGACLPVLWQVCGGGGPSSSSSCNLRFSAFLFAASNLNLRSSPPPSAFTLPTPTFPSSHLSAVLYCFSFMISVLLFSDLPFVSTLLSPSFSPPSSFPPSPFYPSLSSVPPHHESPKLHMRYNQHVLR